MCNNFQKKLWQWRGVLIAAPSVTAVVLLLRFVGLLQMLELAAFDQLFLLRLKAEPEKPDERIVIVKIDEQDITKIGKWPIPDGDLAVALENLKKQKPHAIGLDIYRDLPVEPGHKSLVKVFESTPNLIGVQKVSESIDSFTVAPPPALKKRDQVGANDLPLDGDGKIRRSLLYVSDKNGKNVFSFPFKLAYQYLNKRGILVGQTENYLVKTGDVIFPLFHSNDGGYIRAEDQGYQVLINYRGSIQKFPTISFIDVLNNRIPQDFVKGRIVLIGTTAESQKDLFYTPYSSSILRAPRRMPGVVIHANAVSQILSATLNNRPLIKTWSEPVEWLSIFASAILGAVSSWLQRHNNASQKRYPLRGMTTLIVTTGLYSTSYLAFLNGWWIPFVPLLIAFIASKLTVTSYIARTAGSIRRTFGRYLNDEVVAYLLEHPEGLKLGGERRKITILTSDLRGFTSTSERLPAEEVIKILNLYLGYMADIITKYQGTIDEFMGDGILVLFGAPTTREDDPTRAIACAVAMQQAMQPVNEKMQELGLPKLEMGIGINTGEVVVGNIGSDKRTKYGIVGNQVNLTYRIESYTVGGQILISESTLKEVGDIVKILGEREVQPKGVKQPINIYEVGGIAGDYNLYITQEEEIFFPLPTPFSLMYAVLDGKDIDRNLIKGKLVKMSEKGAEIYLEISANMVIPQPLTNLKMNLFLPDCAEAGCEDIYAKVIEKKATQSSFYIRFTNKPPQIEAQLSAIYKSLQNIGNRE
ncbi:MAG: adenylate/guanylate cyclase domain-containing protein [Nostocaceae cyanobacterium]|nr:adenylate/guanylate cyclase domain-containing protein [Nostocaceae cyanobacterium]